MNQTQVNVNGRSAVTHAAPGAALVDVLRDDLGLSGTKVFCRQGFCGACTVLIDDTPTASCLVPLATVGESAISTIESVGGATGLAPLQQALSDADAVQCGMCFPGMIMTLTGAAQRGELLSRDDIKNALAGNVCRCTGYERIVDAAVATYVEDVP